MATGDRVKIGNGSIWDDTVTVAVYEPRWNVDGTLLVDHFNAAMITKVGGVKGGTLGIIKGQPIKVHRVQLFGEENVPNLGGVDLVNLFPIQFDYYFKEAYVYTNHFRIVQGGLAP